ncbi:hypothetical protein JET76_23100 [Pseudomonas putida]|uniref:hypothetical protein n=1 Tax=Pseudomonas putida TaxID=303 RepID=UPI0018E6AA94|nr:hypothetical protein [Pseudomonas putida]MBI6944217.1 hypothetical protein [Pseudomonas putida]MBI6960318.1 hypothetical protein [Pseudomonas putida]
MADLLNISLRSNIKKEMGKLSASMYKQLPFATAKALTMLAKEVQAAEKVGLTRTFGKAKTFTRNAVGMKGARKDTLEARVFVRPIAARYLDPYEGGGNHVLPGRALLNPKDIKLDKHGQIPRGLLARLKARPDVFIGKVGEVNGVWQRIPAKKASKRRGGLVQPAQAARLKLLIRFGEALPVNKQLNYRSRAKSVVNGRFKPLFNKAMREAMATAR